MKNISGEKDVFPELREPAAPMRSGKTFFSAFKVQQIFSTDSFNEFREDFFLRC